MTHAIHKIMAVRRVESSQERHFALFHVARGHPLSDCCVIAQRGMPLDCGRHGAQADCVEAVRRFAREQESDAFVAKLVNADLLTLADVGYGEEMEC